MNNNDNKEFIDQWIARIKSGIEYRKKYSSIPQWKDYRNMYRGKWDPNIYPVNKIFSYGRTLIPKVYFKAPRVVVTAPSPELVAHAKVVEVIDNMIIRETMLKETLKMSCLDSFLCGNGPIKLGFDSEYGYIPDQALDDDGSTVTQVGQKEGDKIEYKDTVKPGMPWALRVRPEDVVVPWGSTDAQSLPWIAHYILRPLKDIKQDQKYKNTKDLKGTRTPASDMEKGVQFQPTNEKDKDQEYAELWEIRDFSSGEMYVICEDQLLLAIPDALQVEGLPYEFINFNPDPEYFWSISDASILAPQQRELNQISTQSAKHRAIALKKFLYSRGSITEIELEKFLSGEVGPAVAIEGDNIAAAIMQLQPHIPPDLFAAAQASIGSMKESLGFSSNELGEYNQGSPKSATETMTVAEAHDQRMSERRDIVADTLVRVIRKFNQYLFKFWTEPRVAQITSGMGDNSWVEYTGDQLKGEYFISIDADSGMPITRGAKMQMGSELMKMFGGDPMIDQILLRKIALDNFALIDPRVDQLIQNNAPPGMDPAAAAMERQPGPMGAGAGGGKGAGGGRQGSSINKPQEFDSFKRRFNQK